MKSKKKLFAALDELAGTTEFSEKGLEHPKIMNETYGNQSCIYVSFDTPETRVQTERKLKAKGFAVNKDYWPGSCTAEIRVSYFKGYKWDH